MHVTKVLESPSRQLYRKEKSGHLMRKFINRQNYKKAFMFITGSLFYFQKFF